MNWINAAANLYKNRDLVGNIMKMAPTVIKGLKTLLSSNDDGFTATVTALATPSCLVQCPSNWETWFRGRKILLIDELQAVSSSCLNSVTECAKVSLKNGLYYAQDCFKKCISENIWSFQNTLWDKIPKHIPYEEYILIHNQTVKELLPTLLPNHTKALEQIETLTSGSQLTYLRLGAVALGVTALGIYIFVTCKKPYPHRE